MRFPFTRDRFRHELLERDGDVCLVARTNTLTGSVHWEVVVLQHRPAETSPSGRLYPARTTYPASSDWGAAGWTLTNVDQARARMAELCAHVSRVATQTPGLDAGDEEAP